MRLVAALPFRARTLICLSFSVIFCHFRHFCHFRSFPSFLSSATPGVRPRRGHDGGDALDADVLGRDADGLQVHDDLRTGLAARYLHEQLVRANSS